jgi:hypothetical protein
MIRAATASAITRLVQWTTDTPPLPPIPDHHNHGETVQVDNRPILIDYRCIVYR